MRARSAVFDLYGDHLVARGGWAPVATIVTLTGSCGLAGPATRTAISRMTTQGWLAPRRSHGLRGYVLTPAATRRLELARERIYAPGPAPWDRQWHIVVLDAAGHRAPRDRLASALEYLGYGRLATRTWISPRRSEELAATLERFGVQGIDLLGPAQPEPGHLAARVWDLDRVGSAYEEFRSSLPAPRAVDGLAPDVAYPLRADLVHRWRTFLFIDPGLPRAALPRQWPGHRARTEFLACAAALAEPAGRFVDTTLAAAGVPEGVAPRPPDEEDLP